MTTVLVLRLSPKVTCLTGTRFEFNASCSSVSLVLVRMLASYGVIGTSAFGRVCDYLTMFLGCWLWILLLLS